MKRVLNEGGASGWDLAGRWVVNGSVLVGFGPNQIEPDLHFFLKFTLLPFFCLTI